MTPKSNYLIGGLAVTAALISALPIAQGIGAAVSDASAAEATQAARISKIPAFPQVNRAAKSNRLVVPVSISVKQKAPDQSSRQAPLADPAPAADQRPLMDGCEPAFSPVTVPSMANLASRCIG